MILTLCAVKVAAIILTARFHGLPVVPNLDGCAVSNSVEEEPAPAKWHVLMLRIWWVAAVFLLLETLSGCAEEQPGAVPSTTRAAANLATRVPSAPMAVDELRSDRER